MCRREYEATFHGVSWNQSSGPSDAVYCARRRFHRWNFNVGWHDKTAAASDLYHRSWTRAHFHHRLLLRESEARAQRITAVIMESLSLQPTCGMHPNRIRTIRTRIACHVGSKLIESAPLDWLGRTTKLAPNRKIKGATVNRELECLKCLLDLARKSRFVGEALQ